MKKITLLLLLLTHTNFSKAETLSQALVKTYQNNPTLQSARKGSMANDELVAQALSGWRPTIKAEGNVDYSDVDTSPSANIDGSNTATNLNLSISQPVYQGGGTIAETKSAENTVMASHENLKNVENSVLLSAVEAYVDVIRDQAILELNIKNQEVLAKNLEATTARFNVGELTKTDVSQSQASLSDSKAKVITARGNLNSSIADYQSIIGNFPTDLQDPQFDYASLPETKERAIELALNYSPEIKIAVYNNEAAKADVSKEMSEVFPEITVTGEISKTYDPLDDVDDITNNSIKANLTVPLYQSGAVSSRIRQAKHTSNQKQIDILVARRNLTSSVIASFEDFETAASNIVARLDQIEANEIALKGIVQEELVGARTILDVLDAEEDLLDSKVNLVTAKRDKVYKAFELISKLGKLTAADLNLPVAYMSPNENYERVKNKWWGFDVNE